MERAVQYLKGFKVRFAYRILAVLLVPVILFQVGSSWVAAQALPPKPAISFNNFNATYYLSRDAAGRSLLTTEEVILTDFPGDGNFTGITRSIPETYQGRSVEVKILSVSDAGGSPIPYKTSNKAGNLIVTTGDPSINLYGSQTFRINYQTKGVIDINPNNNHLLLDVNGRGWEQTINQVGAVVHIPALFNASLAAKPACYIGYLNTTTPECAITSQKTAAETLVTAKSTGPLAANHTLVVNLKFKSGTFTNHKSGPNKILIAAAAFTFGLGCYAGWKFAKKR